MTDDDFEYALGDVADEDIDRRLETDERVKSVDEEVNEVINSQLDSSWTREITAGDEWWNVGRNYDSDSGNISVEGTPNREVKVQYRTDLLTGISTFVKQEMDKLNEQMAPRVEGVSSITTDSEGMYFEVHEDAEIDGETARYIREATTLFAEAEESSEQQMYI